MTDKSVLVTGASGFIGHRLCLQLRSRGYRINALLHRMVNGPWDQSTVVDLSDDLPVTTPMNVDTIFHLAGIAHDFRADSEMTYTYRKVNIEATVKLASLAATRGVKRFVFVSSVKAGGASSGSTCSDECTDGEPEGIYGQTKREAEIELLRIGKMTGMHVSIIRPTLVYGPNLKGNLQMMLNAIKNGWFPPLPETANIRTMVSVDDLVKAILLAAEMQEANGEIFIVTDGKHYSSRESYNEMCLAIGKKIPGWSVPKSIFYIFARLGDLAGNFIKVPFDTNRYNKLLGDDCYSSAKISKKLGYKPEMTFSDALPKIVSNINK